MLHESRDNHVTHTSGNHAYLMSIPPKRTFDRVRNTPAVRELSESLNLTLGMPFILRMNTSRHIMAKKYGVTCYTEGVYGAREGERGSRPASRSLGPRSCAGSCWSRGAPNRTAAARPSEPFPPPSTPSDQSRSPFCPQRPVRTYPVNHPARTRLI